MNDKMKYLLYGIGGLAVLLIVIFILEYAGLVNYQFFGIRKENARREIFKTSQAYNEGKAQDLAKYKLEYELAKDSSDKQIIKNMIIHSFADYDVKKLPSDLQLFLQQMKDNK